MTTLREAFAEAPEAPFLFLFKDRGLVSAKDVDPDGKIDERPFVAWSDNWVYVVEMYDCPPFVSWVPRRPTDDFEPWVLGGG